MKKHIQIILLVITILSDRFYSNSLIIDEYPELESFLESTEFKNLKAGIPLSVSKNNLGRKTIACFSIGINSDQGFYKILLLNPTYVNKSLISAEELKYIICHELGHIHDKDLKWHILSILGLYVSSIALAALVGKDACQKNWDSLIKKAAIGLAALAIWNLLLKKNSRDGELFADAFAIKITKNKKAAASILTKRTSFVGKKPSKFEILNNIYNYLDDHPNEKIRIENMNNFDIG